MSISYYSEIIQVICVTLHYLICCLFFYVYFLPEFYLKIKLSFSSTVFSFSVSWGGGDLSLWPLIVIVV